MTASFDGLRFFSPLSKQKPIISKRTVWSALRGMVWAAYAVFYRRLWIDISTILTLRGESNEHPNIFGWNVFDRIIWEATWIEISMMS